MATNYKTLANILSFEKVVYTVQKGKQEGLTKILAQTKNLLTILIINPITMMMVPSHNTLIYGNW